MEKLHERDCGISMVYAYPDWTVVASYCWRRTRYSQFQHYLWQRKRQEERRVVFACIELEAWLLGAFFFHTFELPAPKETVDNRFDELRDEIGRRRDTKIFVSKQTKTIPPVR